MKNRHIFQSFKHAFEGLSHVLWTQKHVRTQLFIVVLALLLCYAMQLDVIKVLFVLSAIALVLLAELFNTAIEVVVNMITESYHPLAKVAKDVAAAGVLIASMYALIVAGGIFFSSPKIHLVFSGTQLLKESLHHQPQPLMVLLLCFLVLSILVVLGKSRKDHGSILRGGAVSGHTAVAFMLFSAIAIYSGFQLKFSIPALLLAILVAQSRVEGKIHTVREVLWGAIIALVLMTVLVFTAGGNY